MSQSSDLRPRFPQPIALPGFERVHRYWDASQQVYCAKLMPGESYISLAAETMVSVVGSCVVVGLRDPDLGIGGMCHFMAPMSEMASNDDGDDELAAQPPPNAMDQLADGLVKRGAYRKRLQARLYGGCRAWPTFHKVAQTNVSFAKQHLKAREIPLVFEDTLGRHPRKVYFNARHDIAYAKWLLKFNHTIREREDIYLFRLENRLRRAG